MGLSWASFMGFLLRMCGKNILNGISLESGF